MVKSLNNREGEEYWTLSKKVSILEAKLKIEFHLIIATPFLEFLIYKYGCKPALEKPGGQKSAGGHVFLALNGPRGSEKCPRELNIFPCFLKKNFFCSV